MTEEESKNQTDYAEIEAEAEAPPLDTAAAKTHDSPRRIDPMRSPSNLVRFTRRSRLNKTIKYIFYVLN